MSLDLLERLLPLALMLPLGLEAIVIWGIRLGAFQPLFGAALNALTAAAISSVLTYIAVTYVRRAEGFSAEAANALAACEARFRGIFKHAATGIIITDTRGRFQTCNPAYSAMLGYREDEFRQLNLANLVDPDDRPATWRAWSGFSSSRYRPSKC